MVKARRVALIVIGLNGKEDSKEVSMKLQGCIYAGYEEEIFMALEIVFCPYCGSFNEHLDYAAFCGHDQERDVLVWLKPFRCRTCHHLIRDLSQPCGNYILELEYQKLPSVC